MTSITFEVAAFADAVHRASKISPSVRGAAWDKANGILLSIDPDSEHPLLLRVTNLDVFQTEWVSALSVEGEHVLWRIPAVPLNGIIGGLPIANGRQVTISDSPRNRIQITSGRMKVTLNSLSTSSYPEWDIFDPDQLSVAAGLANAVKSVEWAASNDKVQSYSGVHVNGEFVMATDKWRLAIIPLEITHLKEPVTVPCGTLSTILKENTPPRIGNIRNSNLLVMPDEWTQVQISVLANEYPSAVAKQMQREFDEEVVVDREEMIAFVNHAVALDPANRTQIISVYFGRGEIAVFNTSDALGIFGNVIECDGADHKRIEYRFNPKYLIEALGSFRGKTLTLKYNAPGQSRFIYLLDKQTGYETWVGRIPAPSKAE